jgi:NADPH-dependent glutamate synthase beta subunit-like oxidoreductase
MPLRKPWRQRFEADGYREPTISTKSSTVSGLPGPYRRSRIHPIDRGGRFGDAYLVNWESNVFPACLAHLRRPCEPACRRGRVEEGGHQEDQAEPVAICRLKRVAADYKKTFARGCRGRRRRKTAAYRARRRRPGVADVARDLAPLGYECVVFDGDDRAGGMMRTQIPKFRLPEVVIDEEVGYILDLGVEFRPHQGMR